MIGRSSLKVVAMALVIGLIAALSAEAQITTGTVTGTVKDAQGGVIPGATVLLVSEARGTKSVPAVTNATGDFVFANIAADTYRVEVTMSGFKGLKQSGVVVGAGDRASTGVLTLEIGGIDQTVEVTAEASRIQATSGERSFTVATSSIESLPIASRSFTALASLAPGVTTTGNPSRIGDRSSTGGGSTNFMMDGVSTMDTGSNSVLLQMNVESIAEVKVLVSGYQAEYGRSSGLQISAVTKSGTNRFRGSVYDVERNSNWNSNSKVNKLNGDAKTVSKQRDWGYSIGGPIGKPGGDNKLFFFYSHEYAPRSQGGEVQRYRVPTDLERQGDFSQTTDNNGNLWRYIKDPTVTGTCSATVFDACFADGGVLGRIPANRLYQTGLNILNMYPRANLSQPGVAYNLEYTRPTETALAWQPAVKIDYQPWDKLRASFKYSGWQQRDQVFSGAMPGFTDSQMQNPKVTVIAATVNYSLSPTMFLEATYGHSQNELAGCALAQGGTGPSFCTNAVPVADISNRNLAGLGGLPLIFANALQLNPDYYAYRVLEEMAPPMFQDGQILKTPNLNYGGRVANAPPNTPFPGYFNINATDDIAISLTKVQGRHTFKAGFYNTHSYKAQQQGNPFGTVTFTNDANNPSDTNFPFSNAALGVFQTYQQQSGYVEGNYVYNNTEAFIQDNWKISGRMTLDYGVRFVHQQPQYDELGQASNFFADQWTLSNAPQLYVAACTNGAVSCTGNTRQARNPVTGAFLGPNSTSAIGTLVDGTGNRTNGLRLSGDGISETTYTWPALRIAPRFGMAYDVTGNQTFVLRGGMGLFYDRPSGNSIYAQVTNPPSVRNVTLRNGSLQALSNVQFSTEGAPSLAVYQYESGLPSSTQWNGGVQMMLPWNTSLDVSYTGLHGFNIVEGVNINGIDFGAAYLDQNLDPTLGPPATPGSNTVTNDQMRSFRGYGNINMQMPRGWVTTHTLQLSFDRRFRNGLSFGFNDVIVLGSSGSVGARIEHLADGTYRERADQAEAQELLGNSVSQRQIMKGNFTWDLPDLRSDKPTLRALGLVINDWQFSGIWTGSSGSAYTVGFGYQNGGGNVNLTGSPDQGARIKIVGDPGQGCSSNPYSQFNVAAFNGPSVGSVGLESGVDYLRGCFTSVLDLTIQRTIRLGGGRTLMLRADMFNAPNSAIVTGRNTNIQYLNPGNPVDVQNSPYNADGSLNPARALPRGAGVGVATNYQDPRTVQFQIRFGF